jgi:glycosyltransferase involved in cell wall biosynthesis
MRVGFLALQAPDCSPSQRYRVEAFLDRWQARGITVDYHWVLDRADLAVFYGSAPAASKSLVAARALGRRLASLTAKPVPDVWFVQREAFFLGGAWSEWLASRRAPVVFDFDDAIWIRTTSAANSRYAWLKNVEKIPHLARLAHTVVAGNAFLADWARQHSRNVHVVPTVVDTDHFAPARSHPDGPVVIGWSGSGSTIEHLRPLLPVLERLVARVGDRVQLRVMGDPSFSHAPLGLRGEAWTPAAELDLLRRMDIGIMPLPDDEWSRGKCGLKGLVAMSVGAATVMSPVGVNTDIVRHGDNGFLARSDDEWLEILTTLVDDAALRARIGAAGRQRVVDDYSVARWEPALAGLLETAARSR